MTPLRLFNTSGGGGGVAAMDSQVLQVTLTRSADTANRFITLKLDLHLARSNFEFELDACAHHSVIHTRCT